MATIMTFISNMYDDIILVWGGVLAPGFGRGLTPSKAATDVHVLAHAEDVCRVDEGCEADMR
jgi:hypothetical protein